MTQRRLLVFTENYARGGGNRYCVDLINGLADCFDEIVLASNEGGIFPEDVARLPANVTLKPAPFLTRSRARHALGHLSKPVRAPWLLSLSLAEPLLFARNVKTLGDMVAEVEPDIVLGCNGGYPAARATLAMMVAAKRRGVPAVMSVVSTPTPRRATVGALDKAIDAQVWRSVRLVIVNARAISTFLSDKREMPASLAYTIYNGLPDAPNRGLRGRSEEIGFVARLDHAKGVMVLLEAFAAIAPRWPQLRLHLVGQGDASAAIPARARELGIAERVRISGYIEGSVDELLESFRIYAFPSFHEGLPYSVLEAMRAGCTIVSTNVGGIPEILRDDVEGLLVPPRDADALARALNTLMSDTRLSERLGSSARARFQQNYLLQNFYAATRSAFADAGLLDGSARNV
jgi:hypothetical protein